jgi:hypothetical protein
MGMIEQFFGSGEAEHFSAVDRLRQPIYDEAVITAMKLDGVYHVATHAMERVVDLDIERRALAGSDELRNQMLVELELIFYNKARRLVRDMYDPFGGGW